MFYVYVTLGLALTVGAVILLPWWAALIYLTMALALMVVLPTLLGKILDPRNARHIRAYCADHGISDVEVRPFPNHYGVRFRYEGRKFYAKCTVARGHIKWKGQAPDEMVGPTIAA